MGKRLPLPLVKNPCESSHSHALARPEGSQNSLPLPLASLTVNHRTLQHRRVQLQAVHQIAENDDLIPPIFVESYEELGSPQFRRIHYVQKLFQPTVLRGEILSHD